MDSARWHLGLSYPDRAIPLPVHETEDIEAWAESTAWSWLPADASDTAVDEFARALLDATEDSRTRSPLHAYFLAPFPEHGELARIEVHIVSPGDSELTLEQLTEYFGAPDATSLDPPRRSYRYLPSGPAARIAHQYLGADDETEGALITQTLVYAIKPTELPQGIVLVMTWDALYYRDELLDVGDSIAESIRITQEAATA